MTDAIEGAIRTTMATGIGAFFAWLLAHNIAIDAEAQKALTVGLTALVIVLYYVLVRAVEKRLPTWLRVILIGVPKTPVYAKREVQSNGFEEPSQN